MTLPQEKPSILLVDDEQRILDSLRDLLEENFEVVASTNPNEALEILETAHMAVILADQRMPGLTGDEFLARAQERSDATRILVTGYADIDALIRAVNEGQIFTYVPKPWEPAQLKVTVLKAAKHCQDLTRRKKAAAELAEQQEALARSEAALRHQTKLLQSILDSMGDGVLVADESGKIVLLNPAAELMVGTGATGTPHAEWSERYGIYRPGTDLTYPANELPLARAMRGETADGVELYVRNAMRPDGLVVSVNVRPLKADDGEIKGGVAVVRDITAAKLSEELLRRSKEEAERANFAKSDFLSRMSHELRTPLNSILGFAQLLELAELEGVQNDNVKHILKGGFHLLDLINEILDLARIEAGRLSLSPEPVLMAEVLRDVVDLIRPLALQRNVSLNAEAGLSCNSYVLADRQRLKQVLLNLLGNAIKFNREDGVVLVFCDETPENRLRVEVCDTGNGIDPEGLEKIFTPFERLGADAAAIGGTGLGLALCKHLVEAMGGTIGVESRPGVGSQFHFEVELVPPPGGTLQAEGQGVASANGEPSLRGTVLYIEDTQSNLDLMRQILARYPNVELIVAMTGRSGLELAMTHVPDWILLDVHLPDCTGDEVLYRLRSDETTLHIPVTVVSADATPNQISRLMGAGARDYLTKPLDVKQLVNLLEATIQHRATSVEMRPVP